jgi:hypothetical protein
MIKQLYIALTLFVPQASSPNKIPSFFPPQAAIGEENATFVIAKDKITYPDQNATYKHALVNDSMHIKFDGYEGNYLVKTKGSDTLVLMGDEQQIYYRFKKQ